MEARMLTMHIQRGKLHEAVQKFEQDAVPAMRELPGLEHILILSDEVAGTFIVTTLWATSSQKMDAEMTGFVKAQIDNIAAFFAASPRIDHYTVNLYY